MDERNPIIVMVVENRPHDAERLARWLERRGLEVVMFEGPTAALRHLELNHVDAAVVDLALIPGMNGFDFAIAAIKLGLKSDQFVFVTGWEEDFRDHCPTEFRDNLLLEKNLLPDDYEALLRAVHEVAGLRGA